MIAVLQSVLRYLMAALAGWLVSKNIINPEVGEAFISEATQLMLALAMFVGLILWSISRKKADAYFKRNMAIAGADEKITTPEQVVTNAAKLQAAGNKPGPIMGTETGVGKQAMVTIFMALALAGTISCAKPGVNDTPDQVAARTTVYATDAVRYVNAAQNSISAYAVAQGGRTEATNKPSEAIRDFVIPAAERLSLTLRAYSAASTPDLKNASKEEILKALAEYEKLVGDAIGSRAQLPAGLTTALAQTITDIRTLIGNIRNLFNSPTPVTV
jgi:hypothetical protein